MKLWKLMVSAIVVSVFMLWACTAIDSTVQAEELTAEIHFEDSENNH
ncbi:hypothetical protein ACFLTB_02195 [Chloroflexota bacterium]